MRVKLVSPTAPANLLKTIAYTARVSNPSNQENVDTNEKLIRYLIKHKHWSPFEMANIVLEINTTRDIAKQILRHRSFSFQEFSQRYAKPDSMGYPFEMREARLQDTENRQNSIELNENASYIHHQWIAHQNRVLRAAETAYNWAIDTGIAKEQARAVLPEGLTKTRLYMNGTVRSWIHYIDLRTSPETQKEHRDIATLCAACIDVVFPMILDFVH